MARTRKRITGQRIDVALFISEQKQKAQRYNEAFNEIVTPMVSTIIKETGVSPETAIKFAKAKLSISQRMQLITT